MPSNWRDVWLPNDTLNAPVRKKLWSLWENGVGKLLLSFQGFWPSGANSAGPAYWCIRTKVQPKRWRIFRECCNLILFLHKSSMQASLLPPSFPPRKAEGIHHYWTPVFTGVILAQCAMGWAVWPSGGRFARAIRGIKRRVRIPRY